LGVIKVWGGGRESTWLNPVGRVPMTGEEKAKAEDRVRRCDAQTSGGRGLGGYQWLFERYHWPMKWTSGRNAGVRKMRAIMRFFCPHPA